ncbi:pleckstrin homology domain-containing family G member 7 isoform X1 [Cyanistes caeruleus]|uniref:Pleckstrin homology and RhoGEF domain containing G7 n=1 Tax=Cyanistes caeruleus TaxID=156563 RepID=A0A8C0UP81_CYACU|nr:pleckstrin homology domain-containing family G member 7 isoform X1 [Cyanistes caeruleus]
MQATTGVQQISLSFLKMFFETVKKHVSKSNSPMDFSSILRTFFQGDLCQTHQIYCLNYTSAVFYLEKLRQREDFGIYLKWCEQNEQCKRLHLPELLVAPLHRLTRYPLLLNNIWKRSTDETEKSFIQSLKEKVEKSIRDLEGKVKWLDNFQKFRQLQEVIIWPQVWDRDKRFFVPECLKQNLRENSSENILSSASRLLLHEGRLMLAESTRLLDVYLFLFDDFLLITKIKRNKKKYGGSDTSLIPVCPSLTPELQSFIREGGFCTVLDQPIPLDRLVLKNVEPIQVTAAPQHCSPGSPPTYNAAMLKEAGDEIYLLLQLLLTAPPALERMESPTVQVLPCSQTSKRVTGEYASYPCCCAAGCGVKENHRE